MRIAFGPVHGRIRYDLAARIPVVEQEDSALVE